MKERSPEMERLLAAKWTDPRVEDIAKGMYAADCRSGIFANWDGLTHAVHQVYRMWAAEIVAGMPSEQRERPDGE